MSGFGSTGFGGFGQTNNQPSSGFGGFGSSNTNTGTGFGANNTTSAFGSNSNTNTGGGGLFGGGSTGAFGSAAPSGGFGSNTSTTFGAAKPAFGASTSTGGGLFGSNNNTTNTTATSSGFGGFGGGTTTTNTSSPFGGSGSNLFGANKPAFGSTTNNTTTGTTSLFGGGGGNTSTGFGSNTGTTGGFGASLNPGIGGNVGDPPGTAITPFQAHQEKETTGAGNQSNSFQNVLFQEPYKKWSAEELRLADYAQGRRHGNASGTGAFGVSNFGSTGFGSTNNQQSTGFGAGASTGGGLFGGGTTNNTPSTTTGGFGSGTTGGFGSGGGGLFGNQAKPATGGLFGSNTTATSQPAQSSGLFGGGATNTGGGFGATNTTGGFGSTNNTTGGGLFGSNNNTANQSKPGGFSFGNTGATTGGFGSTNTTGGFGQTNTTTNTGTGGGLFGNNQQSTGGGLFGNNQAQNQQQGTGSVFGGGGGFGQQNNNQAASGGLFGNNQQKPATGGGLFGGGGATNTGGGLFGGGASTTNSFGAANTNNQQGGLFGAKPAATGGGLFGNNTAGQQTNTGGGLFGGLGGNNQQQQQTGQSSLFGGNQNQAKPGGLFGSSQPAGNSLFGGQNNQQQGSIFGGNQQQQQQGSLLGGSMMGTSQGINSGPHSLTANITDVSAFGSPSLFSNLAGAETPNPGPLATPLSSKSKPRRSSILPMYKLNPASAARFVTPQKRGFGFSYSTYGTPGGSPSSAASTPGGASRSLLGSSTLNRSLSKSVSTSNLRRSFNAEDSILAPGAFSASSGPRYYGNNGSVKKLVINKDMRSDLFSTPTKDKPATEQVNGSRKLSKRVSFDTSNMEAPETDEADAAVVSTTRGAITQESTPVSNDVNGTKFAAGDSEQSKGKELAIVHEEDASSQTPEVTRDGIDQAPGAYWMSPTKETIAGMNRVQRAQVADFTVGRDNVGSVKFKVPVDLTNIDLDEIFGGIVILETRSATVYPVAARKPPVGKGLNVPALIALEQSWPRGRDKRPSHDQKRFAKHIERLKRIENTAFESYNADTGVWKFSVEHFTTYGLDYDEDEDEVEQHKDVTTQENVTKSSSQLDSHDSDSSPREDDTFDFRKSKRRALPGAFDQRDEEFGESGYDNAPRSFQRQSFLGDSFAGSTSNALILSTEDEPVADQDGEYGMSEDEDTVGTPLRHHLAAEQTIDSPEGDMIAPANETPGGILRARMRALKGSATPLKLQVAGGDEWMDMLQRSVSPQKRDRAFLRSVNEAASRPAAEEGETGQKGRVVSDGRGFATSIDLMNSLFEKAKIPAAPAPSKGFVQWPYERQTKSFVDQSDMSEADRSYYNSMRPSWGPDGTLIFTTTRPPLETSRQANADGLMITKSVIQVEGRAVQAAKFSNEASAKTLQNQIRMTQVEVAAGVPEMSLQVDTLKSIFHDQDTSNPANAHEKLVWELASILFDGSASCESRKTTLSKFWAALVDSASSKSVALAGSGEEKAIAALSGHRIQDACKYLLDGRNFRLATLVSLIGSNDQSKKDMREQLNEWQEANFLSEFADPIRAIYELLSGNSGVCEGKKAVPLEDRVESFVISQRFGLDWKQAFGLRLWYSISRSDDFSAAVRVFEEDVAQDREQRPQTWYLEQGIPALWDDQDADIREDLLWGLLKLYSNEETDLESVLRPENSQLSPLDVRLCWQLSRALQSTGKVSYGGDANEKADALTVAFADQLVNEGNWLEAIFVLLHLNQPQARAKAVQDILCRHAALLGSETSSNFTTLTQTLRIPSSWIWEAQALYMRAVKKDAAAEVHCLLRAGSFPEAHEVFVHKVAPSAVIGRDYHDLAAVLSRFEGHEDDIPGWTLGGAVYKAFLELVNSRRQRQASPPASVVDKLLAGLPAMQESAESGNITSLAAISEMGSMVAKVMAEKSRQDQHVSQILGLPLTEDAHLKHSLDLSLSYYKGLMAGGR